MQLMPFQDKSACPLPLSAALGSGLHSGASPLVRARVGERDEDRFSVLSMRARTFWYWMRPCCSCQRSIRTCAKKRVMQRRQKMRKMTLVWAKLYLFFGGVCGGSGKIGSPYTQFPTWHVKGMKGGMVIPSCQKMHSKVSWSSVTRHFRLI